MNKKYTIIIIIIIIILTFLLTLNTSPFKYFKILNKRINIQEKITDYETKIPCQEINQNEQIYNYELKEKYKDNKISISSELYNKENELVTEYKDLSKILLKIEIDNKIYNVKIMCE